MNNIKKLAILVALVATFTVAPKATAQVITGTTVPAAANPIQGEIELVLKQHELAVAHSDTANAFAFKEALDLLNGVKTSISEESKARIVVARNNSQAAGKTELANAFTNVLVKAGVQVVTTTTSTPSDLHGVATFHSPGGVDRCNFVLSRGSRAGHVCGRAEAQHVHVGQFVLCPDDLCPKCGRSPQVHVWENGNGLLCHVRKGDGIVAMVEQTGMPAIIVVGADNTNTVTQEQAKPLVPVATVQQSVPIPGPTVTTTVITPPPAAPKLTSQPSSIPKRCKVTESVAPVTAK
jgi:hypothetical protein